MGNNYLRRVEELEAGLNPPRSPSRLLIVQCRSGENSDAAIQRARAADDNLARDGPVLVIVNSCDATPTTI